jgi:sensor histidine kinase YesM
MPLWKNEVRSAFGKNIQLAFWITLLSGNIYLGYFVLGWHNTLYRSLFIVTLHLINFYGFYSWLIPVYYQKKKYVHAFIGGLLLLALLTPFRIIIENNFLISGRLMNLEKFGRLSFVLFTEVAIAAFASLMRLARDNEVDKQQILALERMHLESELRFLKAQMNPHFLFNTINNIYSLTLMKSDKAPEALLRLSGLLRYLLYESQEKVPLGKEVNALHEYLVLFQLKYEQQLNVTLNVTANEERMVEPLVLIPVLENALKHSGVGLAEDAYALLTIYEEGNYLIIESNNSKTTLRVKHEQGGIGLVNIQKRLNMAYPGTHVLKIKDSGKHFSLRIKIPRV